MKQRNYKQMDSKRHILLNQKLVIQKTEVWVIYKRTIICPISNFRDKKGVGFRIYHLNLHIVSDSESKKLYQLAPR